MAKAGTDQHQGGVAVRERPHHAGSAADLTVQPLDHVVGADTCPMLAWKVAVGKRFFNAILHFLRCFFQLDTFSLLSSDGVPEDADAVLIYAPESDISAEEADMLIGHLTDGGKLLVMAGPTEDGTLTNLYKVLSTYGVEAADGIDVSLGGESYTFVRTAPEDGSGEDPVWTYNGDEFDVYDLKTALRAVSAAGFTVETPSGQEEISLTVYLDNADFPSFTLTLYRYDGENCIAAVDGKAAAFVSRSQTVDLIEAVNRLTLGS